MGSRTSAPLQGRAFLLSVWAVHSYTFPCAAPRPGTGWGPGGIDGGHGPEEAGKGRVASFVRVFGLLPGLLVCTVCNVSTIYDRALLVCSVLDKAKTEQTLASDQPKQAWQDPDKAGSGWVGSLECYGGVEWGHAFLSGPMKDRDWKKLGGEHEKAGSRRGVPAVMDCARSFLWLSGCAHRHPTLPCRFSRSKLCLSLSGQATTQETSACDQPKQAGQEPEKAGSGWAGFAKFDACAG